MPEVRTSSLMQYLLKFASLALVAAMAVGYGFYRYQVTSGDTPSTRGERVAAKMGCFNCHGAGGAGGVANPGSDKKTIPGWSGAEAAAYVKSLAELEEWVLDGAPKRLRESNVPSVDSPLLEMPAYRGKVSPGEYRDLLAYLKAVMALDIPDAKDKAALEGYFIAQKTGCFSCHGAGGRGTRTSPDSLARHIPAWEGPVFDDLVRNDQELEDWIRDGNTERMKKNRLANYFKQRQLISMPPYDGVLSDGEIASVIAYIKWLRVRPVKEN